MREVDSGDGRAASACPVTDRMEGGYWSAAILDEATPVSPRSGACRLLLSAHTLGMKILRYVERDKPIVPHFARLCRLCRLAVETEGHALLDCTSGCNAARTAQRHLPHYP
jgi:hypothetical protein